MILGKKLGMTRIFLDQGYDYPVTVIQAGPCTVSQLKTLKNDGYNAIQIGYEETSEKKLNKKAQLGHFKSKKISITKHLREFRLDSSQKDSYKEGDVIDVGLFSEGDIIDISGISKGKGFAGHMKRHGFSGGRASHGKNSVMRKAGSVGAGTSPGRIWKGTRMAGRMGNEKVTIKNQEILRIDKDNNLILVKGSVPGSKNGLLYIRKNS